VANAYNDDIYLKCSHSKILLERIFGNEITINNIILKGLHKTQITDNSDNSKIRKTISK
jgi:hypothetical protein